MKYAKLCFVILLTGCTTLPDTSLTDRFGQSAATSASLFRQGVEANASIALQIAETSEASNFLARQPYSISGKPDGVLDEGVLGPKLAAIGAFEKYGAALVSANSPENVSRLQTASEQFGGAVATFLRAANPSAPETTGSAAALVAQVGGFSITSSYAAHIRKIVASQDKNVATLVAILKSDTEIIANNLDTQGALYEATRQLNLDYIASDQKVDNAQLYSEFKTAQMDVKQAYVMAGVLSQYAAVLDAMAKAHHSIAIAEIDSEQQVQKFVSLVESLAALVKTLKADGLM